MLRDAAGAVNIIVLVHVKTTLPALHLSKPSVEAPSLHYGYRSTRRVRIALKNTIDLLSRLNIEYV